MAKGKYILVGSKYYRKGTEPKPKYDVVIPPEDGVVNLTQAGPLVIEDAVLPPPVDESRFEPPKKSKRTKRGEAA